MTNLAMTLVTLLALLPAGNALRLAARMEPEARKSAPTDCPLGKWEPTDGSGYEAEMRLAHKKYPEVCVERMACPAEKYAAEYKSDCLKPFDAHQFVEAIKGKTVTFIGDSVTREWAFGLQCKMAMANLMADFQGNASMKPKKWGQPEPFSITLTNGAKIQWQNMGMPNGETEWARDVNASGFLKNADIVVANVGAHYAEWNWVKTPLETINRLAHDQARPGARLLFKEYEPTHFHDEKKFGGQTDGFRQITQTKDEKDECGEVALTRAQQTENEKTNFRLEKANALMESNGWEILRVHDLAASQWWMHKGGNDCRHWCTNSPVHDAQYRVLARALGV